MSSYTKILDALAHNQLEFLVTGTWALQLAYPAKMKHYKVSDCDIVIKNDLNQIKTAITVLLAHHWHTTIWGEKVNTAVSAELLKGKYYIRAKFRDLVLDLTYESGHFSWQELIDQKRSCGWCQVVSTEQILFLKKIKNRPQDHEIIRLFES